MCKLGCECVCVQDVKNTCVLRPSVTAWNNIKTKSGRKPQPEYIQTNRTAPGHLTEWEAYMALNILSPLCVRVCVCVCVCVCV